MTALVYGLSVSSKVMGFKCLNDNLKVVDEVFEGVLGRGAASHKKTLRTTRVS